MRFPGTTVEILVSTIGTSMGAVSVVLVQESRVKVLTKRVVRARAKTLQFFITKQVLNGVMMMPLRKAVVEC